MTVMTHPALRGTIVWLAAGALVAAAHVALDPWSVAGGTAAAIATIFAAAFCYMRLSARRMDVSDALGVGIAWLVLAIVAELVMTARLGHGWYALIGTPERPLLRNLFLFTWVFAPSVFTGAR